MGGVFSLRTSLQTDLTKDPPQTVWSSMKTLSSVINTHTHKQGLWVMKFTPTRVLDDLSQPAESLQSETLMSNNWRVHHFNPERLRLTTGVPLCVCVCVCVCEGGRKGDFKKIYLIAPHSTSTFILQAEYKGPGFRADLLLFCMRNPTDVNVWQHLKQKSTRVQSTSLEGAS